MRYPPGLVFDSARHIVARKLRGEHRFAVTLSLRPLGTACKRATAGEAAASAGQDGEPLRVAECLAAVDECGAPVVSVCGREPLDYPEIPELTRAILDRGKHLVLCTDGTQIRRRLHMIPPETRFFWNVSLDGTQSVHDGRAGRPGQFLEALDGIKAAKNAGFFVLVTTTIHPETNVRDVAALFATLHAMHVDGYLFSPVYPEGKLCRVGCAMFHEKLQQRFREASEALDGYNLLNAPAYLEYLRGERELDCCAWGNPAYGPEGWSRPCSVLDCGHEESYRKLLEKTSWENFGRGMNPRCETCSRPEGFETAAILGMNPKAGDVWKMLAWQFSGSLGERRNGMRKP